MKDHLKLTAYTDISDILPAEEILARLRNECFVDIQSLEMNKRRITVASESNAHAYIFGQQRPKQTEGLLKQSILQNHSKPQDASAQPLTESKREKKKFGSIFEKDEKYKQQFEAFETKFDNSLTIDNESDRLKMDNVTFIRILHEQQQQRGFDEWKVSELFIPSDRLRPFEIPFQPDGTTICSVKQPSYDIISTRSGAAVASLSITLNQMVTHALNLHKHNLLTQTGL